MAAIPGPFNIGFDFSAGGSRILSPTQGGGGQPAETIVVEGVTYRLLNSRTTGQYLTSRTTGEPIYGRAA